MENDNIVSRLSLHQQKYIETIYELCDEHEHDHAHSKAIAERLSIKMPSVTEALRTLSGLGLINYEVRKAITLTDLGEAVARTLDCRHKNLESFFVDVLGCEADRASAFACDIEHVIDCELSSRLGSFIEFIHSGSESRRDVFDEFKKQYEPNCGGCRNGVSGQCSSNATT